MKTSVILVDGFYDDPDRVRSAVLGTMAFDVFGNYPGRRTAPARDGGAREALERLLGLRITSWDRQYNGAFQLVEEGSRTWIHADETTHWAAVLYLTQNAPTGTGTSFYRHRATGAEHFPLEPDKRRIVLEDGSDPSRWERIDRVGNLYNRLVLYDASRFHVADGYFGDRAESARLTQVFFFDT